MAQIYHLWKSISRWKQKQNIVIFYDTGKGDLFDIEEQSATEFAFCTEFIIFIVVKVTWLISGFYLVYLFTIVDN